MKKLIPLLSLICALGIFAPAYSWDDECYTTREEMSEIIFALQDSFPDFVKVDSIGHSRGDQLGEEFPLYAVKFSDNVAEFEDEPVCLLIGHIHAEEVVGMEAIVEFMRLLCYRRFAAPYREMIENTQIYIVPTMNPDGLEVITQGIDPTLRKNGYVPPQLTQCNVSLGIGGDSCGVDLNRNSELNWIWGDSLWEWSAAEAYDYYRGPAPMSEPEMQAIAALADEIKPTTSIVWHSSRSGNVAERCIVAWKWGETPQPLKYSPDSASIGRVLGDLNNGYISKTQKWGTTEKYLAVWGGTHNGALQDWFYWKLGCIQITTESSPGTGQIQPPCEDATGDSLGSLVPTLIPPNEWMVRRLINLPSNSDPEDMNNQGAALAIYTTNAQTGDSISAEWRVVNTWSPLLHPWYTNEQHGRATFLPKPGPVTVMARKEGFVSDTGSTTINQGAGIPAAVINLELEPLPWYDVTIQVEDESGEPVPARVLMDSEFPREYLLSAGEAVIAKPGGVYTIGAFPITEDKIARWNSVWIGQDTTFTFVLPGASVVLDENFDTGLADWTSGGDGNLWELDLDTTAMVFGQSLATNPNPAVWRPTYAINSNSWIQYNSSINLSDDNGAHLSFDRRGRMDVPADSFFVEVSTDGGTSWEIAKGYCDQEIPWVRDWVRLDRWTGQLIMLRFRLQTDNSLNELGMHIDNLKILGGIDLAGDEKPAVVPYEYTITSAYPNPFNPSTTIAYTVAAPGDVTFAIFNLLGQEVWRTEEFLPMAGAYRLQWNGTTSTGRALASGLYFARMQTNVVHATKKLMLLK